MLTSGLVTVGRDVTNDLVIEEDQVSDFHMEVFQESSGGIVVKDLLSASGTFVNERRIAGPQQLQTWDVIRIGTTEVELVDPSAAQRHEWFVDLVGLTSPQTHKLKAVTTIGRDPSCDLVLDSDLLSRRHVQLQVLGDHVQIQDLGSINGSFLNGKQFEQVLAQPGDRLQLDTFTLQLRCPGLSRQESDAPSANSSRSTVVKNDATEALVTRRNVAGFDTTELLDDAQQSPVIVRLLEITSFMEQSQHRLPSGEYRIGRDSTNHLVVADASVSKHHASLSHQQGRWQLTDLKSSNGVRVNDAVVARCTLTHGDVIVLGRAKFRFDVL